MIRWFKYVPALLIALAAGVATAQQKAPEDGVEFKRIQPELPTEVGPKKVEVIEFFWYGCPHCFALEPSLKEWVKKLPADVGFRKVHVPFQVQAHQQLYYTLETMGKADAVGDRVFAAIHTDRNRLDTPEAMIAVLEKHGVDRQTFLDTYKSFGVRTKMQRANQLAQGYKIEGVPSLGVNGRYLTAPSMAGSNAAALNVVDQLVDRERKLIK